MSEVNTLRLCSGQAAVAKVSTKGAENRLAIPELVRTFRLLQVPEARNVIAQHQPNGRRCCGRMVMLGSDR